MQRVLAVDYYGARVEDKGREAGWGAVAGSVPSSSAHQPANPSISYLASRCIIKPIEVHRVVLVRR